MQVEEPHEELDPERFTPEDFLFPSLCKQGLGLVCEYCAIMTGYSIRYPSMNCYLEHVCMKHQGYSVYAFPEDLVRAKIQIELDYRRKLRDQITVERALLVVEVFFIPRLPISKNCHKSKS